MKGQIEIIGNGYGVWERGLEKENESKEFKLMKGVLLLTSSKLLKTNLRLRSD